MRKKERGLVEKKKWSVLNLARYQQAMRRVRGEREAEEVRAKEEEGSQQVDFFVGWVGGWSLVRFSKQYWRFLSPSPIGRTNK